MKNIITILILIVLVQYTITTFLKSTPPLESKRGETIDRIVDKSVRGE